MRARLLLALLFIGLAAPFSIAPASAAPLPPSDTCRITGVLKAAAVRTEQRNKSWAASWGLASSITYLDLDVDVAESVLVEDTGMASCPAKVGRRVFQLRDDNQRRATRELIGTCIEAMSKLTGDEFRAGDYLWDIKPVAADRCAGLD